MSCTIEWSEGEWASPQGRSGRCGEEKKRNPAPVRNRNSVIIKKKEKEKFKIILNTSVY
jgi:hypothetical protein